jgi:ribosomal protein S18 acetylase RimI-like enzyme
MSKINLKRATIKDIPELIAVEEKLTNLKTYSASISAKEWADELNKKETTVYLIFNRKKVVGNASYDRKSDDLVYISGLTIDPQFHNQGIGKEAMAIILEELKNVKTIKLVTHPENSAAIKIYLSFGFVIKSWKENYFGDGEPRIELIKEQAGK